LPSSRRNITEDESRVSGTVRKSWKRDDHHDERLSFEVETGSGKGTKKDEGAPLKSNGSDVTREKGPKQIRKPARPGGGWGGRRR